MEELTTITGSFSTINNQQPKTSKNIQLSDTNQCFNYHAITCLDEVVYFKCFVASHFNSIHFNVLKKDIHCITHDRL